MEAEARPKQVQALHHLPLSQKQWGPSTDMLKSRNCLNSEIRELGSKNGNKTVLQSPNQGKAKVFEGVAEADVKAYFEQLTGTSLPQPVPLTIRGNVGVRYTVDTPEGNFVLRDVSSSMAETGPAWTIEIPRGVAHPKARIEIKFLKENQ
jgi:filamentous hemagglutinin